MRRTIIIAVSMIIMSISSIKVFAYDTIENVLAEKNNTYEYMAEIEIPQESPYGASTGKAYLFNDTPISIVPANGNDCFRIREAVFIKRDTEAVHYIYEYSDVFLYNYFKTSDLGQIISANADILDKDGDVFFSQLVVEMGTLAGKLSQIPTTEILIQQIPIQKIILMMVCLVGFWKAYEVLRQLLKTY